MKDAYMLLEGGKDETGEDFDTSLLKEARDNNQTTSAMRYVAGAITYKVNKMPDNPTFISIFDFAAQPSTWDIISRRVH